MATDRFMNKYRIASARKPGWDYSAEGLYFITICTAGRICWFGSIENQQMVYSEIGKIVLNEWEKSFTMRTELFCDAFVIMPNHIHGLLRIDKRRDARPCVSTKTPHGVTGIAIRPPKSISSFVAGFK